MNCKRLNKAWGSAYSASTEIHVIPGPTRWVCSEECIYLFHRCNSLDVWWSGNYFSISHNVDVVFVNRSRIICNFNFKIVLSLPPSFSHLLRLFFLFCILKYHRNSIMSFRSVEIIAPGMSAMNVHREFICTLEVADEVSDNLLGGVHLLQSCPTKTVTKINGMFSTLSRCVTIQPYNV